jgi:MoaA/NifB/PqqE/SkfB family radical SAM enzyme
MKNSVIYLTRKCPRKCLYCKIRDDKYVGKELTTEQWIKAFSILKDLKVEFNLILGNEPWLLGESLIPILGNGIPYALYTSGIMKLFCKHEKLFSKGLNNLSIGIDYPRYLISSVVELQDDSYKKSVDAWKIISYVRKHYPHVQVHATTTIHSKNYRLLPLLISQLTEIGVYSNLNFIHWDKDGKYDFFPSENEIKELLIKEEEYPAVTESIHRVKSSPGLLQNLEMFEKDIPSLIRMEWHCKGNPYGGPTVDADGTLRVCGYRKGEYTSKMTIFDLPEYIDHWEEAVYQDAMNCPGCSWSCSWMYHYWMKTNPNIGSQVFEKHFINRKK